MLNYLEIDVESFDGTVMEHAKSLHHSRQFREAEKVTDELPLSSLLKTERLSKK